MIITPFQFAQYLKKSTLTLAEQRGVLRLLPSLSPEQIQELGKVLLGDVEGQASIIREHMQKRDQLLLKYSIEMDRLKNE